MAEKILNLFYLLLLLSVCLLLFNLPSEYSLSKIRWPSFSVKIRHRAQEWLVDFGAEKGNSTSPTVFTQTTKHPDYTKKKNVTEMKNDQMGPTRGAVAETPMPVLLKSSYKKLPEWDFEDIYNQDAPPRQTTCAKSLRNSEDENFKKNFLPNIRLYMHKDNVNMSEWNRLSHFNNPFGFMGFKHDDVMTSVKLIPKPKEPLLLPKPGADGCVSCAVVAGAGILNGSKKGEEIDAHDYVFRMNGAITKGYEEDVGNRTSVPRTYYAGQYNETRFYVLHQDFLRYVKNRFLKSRGLLTSHWAIVRPTNGAFTLFLALHTCDTVSAYGFMTDDYKEYSNYYFQKIKKNVVFYANHDYIMEKNLWKNLHDSNILNLYQRTNSTQEPGKENKL
ncbi:alpha-N-acetylgalactosaminide alpha-2,6-sialyltransferase 1-like isoform X3 [Eleginops maclovinus]|uniref:alpha-N-acetylgalactosaminide alpha-2,6-sialyltransferase 1-like isoform X3 n=1 Tax=Eleginops maclovinus TaxID=56733 RepID=UPI003080E218